MVLRSVSVLHQGLRNDMAILIIQASLITLPNMKKQEEDNIRNPNVLLYCASFGCAKIGIYLFDFLEVPLRKRTNNYTKTRTKVAQSKATLDKKVA